MSETGRRLQSNSPSIHLESHVQGTVLSVSKHKILLLSNLLIEFQVKNWGTHNKPEDRSTWASLLVKQWEEESWQQGVHRIVSTHSWQLQIRCGQERCRNLAILKGGGKGRKGGRAPLLLLLFWSQHTHPSFTPKTPFFSKEGMMLF